MGESKNVPQKKGLPNSRHAMTRATQTDIITAIDILRTVILSRWPNFFRVIMRVFLDEPIS
jgi:hypothetical protein